MTREEGWQMTPLKFRVAVQAVSPIASQERARVNSMVTPSCTDQEVTNSFPGVS